MRLTLIIFCVLFILPNHSKSQVNSVKDSLLNSIKHMPNDSLKVGQYGTFHEKLMFSHPELAYTFAKKEYELSKKINYIKGIAGSNLHFGNYYYNQNKLDSAQIYYLKGLKIFESIPDALGQIFANHSLASIEKDKGNYNNALEFIEKNISIYQEKKDLKSYHNKAAFNLIGAEYELIGQINILKGNYNIALLETLKALRFFEEKKDTIRKADALNQLGKVEILLQNYDSSIEYSKKAINIYNKYNDKFYQAITNNQLGSAYTKMNKLKDARKCFQEARALSKEIDAKINEAHAIEGLGKIFFEEKNYPKANKNFKLALNIYKELGFKNEVAIALNMLSAVEVENKNWNIALDYINQSIKTAKQIRINLTLSENYLLRSKIYEKLNRVDLALIDHKQYRLINDSIFNETKSKQIEELRTIYETEKKEQQIKIQKNEIDLLNVKGKVNNLQRLLLSLGLLIALISIYALFQRNKRNKLAKEKAQTELEFKTKELTTHALHLAKKNEVLNDLKQKAKVLKADANADPGYQMLIQTINFDLQDDNNWENFSRYFEEVHKDFNTNAQQKYPSITANDLRFMALLKMNLTSKEIANILNISYDGIKKARQRLRKKLGINPDQSLEALVISI